MDTMQAKLLAPIAPLILLASNIRAPSASGLPRVKNIYSNKFNETTYVASDSTFSVAAGWHTNVGSQSRFWDHKKFELSLFFKCYSETNYMLSGHRLRRITLDGFVWRD